MNVKDSNTCKLYNMIVVERYRRSSKKYEYGNE